jgi:hypothetical protein
MKWYFYFNQKEMANFLKEKLENKYRDKDINWHVIIGRNFGSNITFQEKIYCYFYIGQLGFMIFATPEV